MREFNDTLGGVDGRYMTGRREVIGGMYERKEREKEVLAGGG